MKNRVTERDLRDFLTGVGYYGRSAKVHVLELIAVGDSGWVQVFEFHLEAKHQNDGWQELYGYVRDDERQSFAAELFDTSEERDAAMAVVTAGLKRTRRDREPASWVSVAASGLVLILLAGLAIARMFGGS